MQEWLSLAGVILAGSITPGPNNTLALRAGLTRSARASAATVFGVQIGSLVLLALCWVGMASLLKLHPVFGLALAIAGAGYLAWLGVMMLREQSTHADRLHVASFEILPIAAMQVVNPKAWIFIATLTALAVGPTAPGLKIAILFVAISSVSLIAWSLAGAQMARLFSDARHRLWVDRGIGLLLILFALTLGFEQLKRF